MVTTPFCHNYYHHESEDQPEDCNPLFPQLPRTHNLAQFAWPWYNEHIRRYFNVFNCKLTAKETQEKHNAENKNYLMRSWNQLCCRRNTKLRSRSFRVVVSSISSSGLSVIRPWEDPFKSNRLWIGYSEQKRLPITMNRVWLPIKQKIRYRDA